MGILVNERVYGHYNVSVCCDDTEGILGINLEHKKTGSVSVVVSNYLPPASSSYGRDCESYFDRLLMLSYEQNESDMTLFCGDFNARIGNAQDAPHSDIVPRVSVDKTVNVHGNALLGFLNDNNCCILNGRTGNNKFTCTTYNGSSVVDYVITHHEMLKNILNFRIYCIEELIHDLKLEHLATDTCIPDHNVLSVSFRSSGVYVEDFVCGLGLPMGNEKNVAPRKYHANYMKNDRFQRVLPTLIQQAEQRDLNQKEVDELYESVCAEISMEMRLHGKRKKRKNTAYKPYWYNELSELWSNMQRKYAAA